MRKNIPHVPVDSIKRKTTRNLADLRQSGRERQQKYHQTLRLENAR